MNSQNLFKLPRKKEIINQLESSFDHSGILLFRGRELAAIRNYMLQNPLVIEKKVLDLGCGEGQIGKMLFNKIDIGLDVVESELKKAKRLIEYRDVVLADARKMPFESGFFNIVFSNSVIEHIEGIDGVLQEVSRILKKRGVFIFTVPTSYFGDYLYFANLFKKFGFKYLAKAYSRERNKQLSHFNLLNHKEWEKELDKYLLKVIFYKYYLSREEVSYWDKICILLRLTRPFATINKSLKNSFNRRVRKILNSEQNLKTGGALLVVAQKA